MKTIEALTESFNNTLSLEDKIKDLRVKAFEDFSKAGIPNRKQEYWKFSDPSVILNLDLNYNDSTSDINEEYLSLIHI